ncbi:hypothetical protein MTYM_01108 [Methylococcales bacterium]|nr:hypothetical protein MTYM_01108 [Methylococcales bacterium]
MGLDAQVIAIGPYSSEVTTSLEYGTPFYAGIAPGSVVVTNVFIAGTSESSHKLASAFGVGAMELGKHKLDPGGANIAQLTDLFGEDNVAQFQCLARHGFSFFYLPNA